MTHDAYSSSEIADVIVVGSGVLGLEVARGLLRPGRLIHVLEAAPSVGGLASGWTIESEAGPVSWDRFYHVVLRQDRRVLQLLDTLGLRGSLHWSTARSQLLAQGHLHEMSSVLDYLRLPVMSLPRKLRVAATVLVGALTAGSARADHTTALSWLQRWSGPEATQSLWLPLLRAKLGDQAETASSVFIRSTFRRLLLARLSGGDGDRLGWIEGGYTQVLQGLADDVESRGGRIHTSSAATSLHQARAGHWVVRVQDAHGEHDLVARRVVITVPGPPAAALLSQVSAPIYEDLRSIPYLGCVCVSFILSRPITDGYVTYVTDDAPFTAIIEMSNLIPPEQLAGKHLIYLPRYADPGQQIFDEPDESLIRRFREDLITRIPGLRASDFLGARVARARSVMPVPVPGRRMAAPPVRVGLPGVYLASSAQVTTGTLNIETTLRLVELALAEIRRDQHVDEGNSALRRPTPTALP